MEEALLLRGYRLMRRGAVGVGGVIIAGQLVAVGVAVLVAASEIIVVIHKVCLLFRQVPLFWLVAAGKSWYDTAAGSCFLLYVY